MTATVVEEQAEEYTTPERYSVYVDFDGVIHSYVSGWVAPDEIPDPPVKGAIEWLNELVTEYEVFIFTTRARYPEAHVAILSWLREHGFTGECQITHEKGPALLYLDDRGWRFKGVFPSLNTIRNAWPWRTGDTVLPPIKEKLIRKNKEIHELEAKLGRRKAELRQLKATAQEVVDYYSVDGAVPEPLERLRGFLKPGT